MHGIVRCTMPRGKEIDYQFEPVKLDRKEAVRRGEQAETPSEARVRIGRR